MQPLSLNIAEEFPITKEWVYFNHAAVCPLPNRVVRAIQTFADQAARVGATEYSQWKARLQQARELSAKIVGCETNEIAFVKNTTHGLMCVANSIDWREGDNLVMFEGEFPANYWPWRNLERLGVEVHLVSLRNGLPDLRDLEEEIDSRTRLATVSLVGYANGYRIDGAEFGEICRRHRILACVDGIQGLGAIPVAAADWGIDFLAADGHKWLLAPEGMGLLFCANQVVNQLNESMTGWCSREGYSDYEDRHLHLYPDARRFEEGSHNMLAAHALAAALELLLEMGIESVADRIKGVTDLLAEGLKRKGWEITSSREGQRWSGILMASKEGVDPERLAKSLFSKHIYIAPRAGKIRFSPHFYNTEDEVQRVIEAIE